MRYKYNKTRERKAPCGATVIGMSKYHDKLKKLFDTQKEGKGVAKNINIPKNFTGFFSYFKLHLHDIFRVNLLLIIGNFPIFFFLYAMTGNLNYTSTAPTSQLFPVLHGVFLHGESSPAFAALYGVHGIQGTLSVTTTATTVMMLLALLLALTLGPITTAATYIFRNLLRGEPIFFFSDIRYVIKRNLSQSIILGIIDCAFTALLTYNIVFAYLNGSLFTSGIVMWGNIVLAILYLLMRPYLYTMLVTFELSTFKLFKNALIFAVIGAKRNTPALLGAAVIILLNYLLIGLFMPLGITLPLVITVGAVWYIMIYAAYPKIKEIMIDPYYKSDAGNENAESEAE